ncbi:hypothetical protein [Clostridium paraputrificum]|uniref:hypothetical protein n=1 Tax=Clostridium paraputrificum TaxID=29363 RepID=UPI001B3C598C|nr:hypothetical protein [Clostridium paraputrificum]
MNSIFEFKEINSPINNEKINLLYHEVINIEELEQESLKNMEYIGETIENKAKTILFDIVKDIQIRNFYAYIIREMLRNIPEHSESSKAELNIYMGINQIAFIVSDEGIGVRESLNKNPKYRMLNDQTAVTFAIRPGITRSYKWDNLRDEMWQNSGFGLYMVSSLMKQLGYFFLQSGDGAIELKGIFKEFPKVKRINGTRVVVIIDTTKKINIPQVIKEISIRGSEEARSSNKYANYADIKTASKASTLID